MHPEATRMRTDAWSAAPLHRKAPACASAMATPPGRGRLPVDLLSAGAVHDAQRRGQPAAGGGEHQRRGERGQKRDDERRQVAHS
jgi:hypothetical protein